MRPATLIKKEIEGKEEQETIRPQGTYYLSLLV